MSPRIKNMIINEIGVLSERYYISDIPKPSSLLKRNPIRERNMEEYNGYQGNGAGHPIEMWNLLVNSPT
ncbi:hypothetical protein QVD99_003371 [Batrachochytrium dendrobatidis]|nr:hypothetical protein QVD99_003371 [Batrachochytrium dendrobatidis]